MENMFIKLLKAIAELVYVSVRLGYVFIFYPYSTPTKRAKKIIDPEYDGDEYGSAKQLQR